MRRGYDLDQDSDSLISSFTCEIDPKLPHTKSPTLQTPSPDEETVDQTSDSYRVAPETGNGPTLATDNTISAKLASDDSTHQVANPVSFSFLTQPEESNIDFVDEHKDNSPSTREGSIIPAPENPANTRNSDERVDGANLGSPPGNSINRRYDATPAWTSGRGPAR